MWKNLACFRPMERTGAKSLPSRQPLSWEDLYSPGEMLSLEYEGVGRPQPSVRWTRLNLRPLLSVLTLPTGSGWPSTPWPDPSPSSSHISMPLLLLCFTACRGAGVKEVPFEACSSEMGFAAFRWWRQREEG